MRISAGATVVAAAAVLAAGAPAAPRTVRDDCAKTLEMSPDTGKLFRTIDNHTWNQAFHVSGGSGRYSWSSCPTTGSAAR